MSSTADRDHFFWRRRFVMALLVAPSALVLGGRGHAAAMRRPTPSQTEGPFYPVEFPRDSDFDLLRNGALSYPEGRTAWLEGSVTDLTGRPVAGASVEIWQCDHAGRYHHPGDGGRADKRFQGFGRVTVGTDGSYRFRTIQPAPYSGRTPHIHLKVKLGSRELLTTQVYVRGDPGNTGDFLWQSLDAEDRNALTIPFEPVADGSRGVFQIVVAT